MKAAFFILLAFTLLPAAAGAAELLPDQPRWSLEVKGGTFAPAVEGWSHYYGKKTMSEYGVSLAYKIRPQIELGAGTSSMKISGHTFNQAHGTPAGDMTYELYPIELFILARGVVVEDQWLVPYIGGGWTRMNYRETIQNQETVRGAVDGYHVRGGVQLSLDNLDHAGSSSMYLNYHVLHTYFILEAEYTRAVDRSTSLDLGGTSYRGGLLFEF